MRSRIAILAAATAVAAGVTVPATATTGKGSLFHDGAVVGTVVVPAHVAPGDGPYHGGDWQVWLVTFKDGVTPYLLTSDEAVLAARSTGDVTVTRAPDADFRCPVT